MKLSRRFSNPAVDLLSEFDQLFSRAFNRPVFLGEERNTGGAIGAYEADAAWHLRTDLPGFTKEDVELRLEDGVLHLAAERKDSEHPFHSRIERTFRVPDHIDPAGITARLENGILELTLPKLEPKAPDSLRIEVK
ncbi:MAG: Hsp20/alpha crystallin family protein [Roseibacillus sp.]